MLRIYHFMNKLAYAFGVFVQFSGLITLLFCLFLAWLLSKDIAPFRYVGF